MLKTINYNDAVRNLKKLLEEVKQGTNQYIVKDNGHEMAVLLSLDDYNIFQQLLESRSYAKKNFFEMVDELRAYNKDIPFEQIEKDVAQAVAEARQEKYRKRSG